MPCDIFWNLSATGRPTPISRTRIAAVLGRSGSAVVGLTHMLIGQLGGTEGPLAMSQPYRRNDRRGLMSESARRHRHLW